MSREYLNPNQLTIGGATALRNQTISRIKAISDNRIRVTGPFNCLETTISPSEKKYPKVSVDVGGKKYNIYWHIGRFFSNMSAILSEYGSPSNWPTLAKETIAAMTGQGAA